MTNEELREAIEISLFTKRGWWGDSFNPRPLGSRLHELDRMTNRKEILQKSKDYTLEALQWLLDEKFVDDLIVITSIIDDKTKIEINLGSKGKVTIHGTTDFTINQ